MFFKYHILFLLILLTGHAVKAFSLNTTSEKLPKFFAVAEVHQGSLLERYNFVMKDYYVGLNVKLGWQTDDHDKNPFDVSYRYPKMGVGYYTGNMNGIILGNDDASASLGKPAALYAFFGAPMYRGKKFVASYNIGAGLSYNFNAYNPENNPFNILIGSESNVYLEFSFDASFLLPGHSTLVAGLSYLHFSNGSYQKPNKGVNLISATLAYQWSLYNNRDKSYMPIALPEWRKSFEWNISLGGGVRMLDTDFDKQSPHEGKRWPCITLSTAVLKQVSFRRKWGAGIDLLYYEWGDYVKHYRTAYGSNVAMLPPSPSKVKSMMKPYSKFSSNNFTVGLYAAHEVGYKRLWIVTDLGFYPLPRVGDNPSSPIIYERLGLKVELTNRLFVGVAIKAHGFKADHTEWSVGYAMR